MQKIQLAILVARQAPDGLFLAPPGYWIAQTFLQLFLKLLQRIF